ncbi:cation:proton antiporter [Spirochaetia bacterium]|nr:cation:proton antiporter [Spirochaetia bacterium]
MIERILLLLLFLAGFYGLIARRNLIKKVYALSIMNMAVLLLFIVEGGGLGSQMPIVDSAGEGQHYVDPLPQALMLTAIVVGVCISIVALTLIYRLYRVHKTLDCEELRERIHHE